MAWLSANNVLLSPLHLVTDADKERADAILEATQRFIEGYCHRIFDYSSYDESQNRTARWFRLFSEINPWIKS